MSRKPNILFIFSDQHRHDVLGCAGHPLVSTPNLDRLAAEGVRFRSAWCQSPICQPSRASVITGAHTEDLGLYHNTGDFDQTWPTVMKELQHVGYETATVGKTHYHGRPPREDLEQRSEPYDMREYNGFVAGFGWDYVLEEYDKYAHVSTLVRTPYTDYLEGLGLVDRYREQIQSVWRLTSNHWRGEVSEIPQEHDLTSFIADQAMDWLNSRNTEKPFLLKLAFVQPHVPLIADPIWSDYYRDADIALPEQTPAEVPNEVWGSYLESLNSHSQIQTMDDAFMRKGIRQYLGMVSLVDQKIGSVLELLEARGELSNTWIVYSADHGEMLGEHHLWAKMNFYKGSVQVPLIIRPPGGAKGSEIDSLVELTDVTATLADIAQAAQPGLCRGKSLVPACNGGTVGRDHLRSRIRSYAAVRTDRYRFTADVDTGTPCELFDLTDDPGELTNLVNDSGRAGTIADLQQLIQ